MSIGQEFKSFALRGKVIDWAVGIIMGGTFSQIVSTLVSDVLMPLLRVILPGKAWREITLTPLKLQVGHLWGEFLDFIIIVELLASLRKKAPEPVTATKQCPECLETIPIQARRCRAYPSILALFLLVICGHQAQAQVQPQDPVFRYGKYEGANAVEWKAESKLGLIVTSGNSQSRSCALGLSASRKANMNKFSFDANWTYANANVLTYTDLNANGLVDIGEMSRQNQTTADSWVTLMRYDRFFTKNNSGYILGRIGGDQPAGKDLLGSGQVGYSRLLYRTDLHQVTAELGYDFSYEQYVSGADSITIQSLRFFAGYAIKLSQTTGLFANVESFFNLNAESVPTADGTNQAKAFKDTRVIGKVGVSSTLWQKLSFSLNFTAKYDNVPAPLAPFKIPFASGFTPLSDKVDTITEAALVYSYF